ncbi:MAG: acetyl-CoA carboxylase biotin carboxyl carrier protein subunit [Bryobacteraceae bacterium]|nr:acetyl-CoA carboxylase biotin carboxyl carrier protein subunit [Bryobacteraceae bacterium]
MTRTVQVNGHEVVVELSDDSAVEAESGLWSVILNGRSFEVSIGEDGIGYVDGQRVTVQVNDPRAPRKRVGGGTLNGKQTLVSAMPGKIVRVLVQEGDAVVPGQGIVIVEAMKMQNEMKASASGTVVRVHAVEGATVNAGEILAVVE